jgi:DNA-binding transcriptional regulator YhcF (GntR family)
VGQETEKPNIFRKVHALYKKRSEVVHGTEDVKLEYMDISTLQKYVREAIKRLIHIDMSKEKYLTLLDESVYDEEKRKCLTKTVMESMKKW